jgi:hypothetical protein
MVGRLEPAPKGKDMSDTNNQNQNENYPAWMNEWNAKASEIDDQIIDFFKDLPEHTSEAWDSATERLQAWWDKQTIDDKAREEFAELKANTAKLTEKIQTRVKELVDEGRLKLARKE